MLYLVIGALVALFITYLVFTLLSASGTNYADHSIEAFIIESDSDSSSKKKIKVDQYHRKYDKDGRQLLIAYGTEYGFSEEIAKKLFDQIEASISKEYLWQPRLVNVKHHESVDFSREHAVFIVISTAGDGVPPTEARPFFNWLSECREDFSHISYSVLALGDSNYPHYCKAGKLVDSRLKELGAKQVVPRHDIDMEEWDVINSWVEQVLESLGSLHVEPNLDYLEVPTDDRENSGPSRNRPFMAKLLIKRDLTHNIGEDDKETIHCEFDLQDSGITWTSGDALGIYPANNPAEVDLLLKAMGCKGTEAVDAPKWAYEPKPENDIDLGTALHKYYDLKTVRAELLQLLLRVDKQTACQSELEGLLKNGVSKKNTFLHEYLYEREVADVLEDFREVASCVSSNDILSQMKGLQPRYYSIASSPFLTEERCTVTAAIVRYNTLGRHRTGVTTTYLQDRMDIGQSCPVFISQNPEFRLPEDGAVPIILVGPGTGIAPFMAFISERLHNGATGKIILYFGCRNKAGDFLYKNELESWAVEGKMELRTAFSRDQAHKIYVQHLIKEDAEQIWKLVNDEAAHIYICGDARHMAHDVHKELVAIVQTKQNVSKTEAEDVLMELEAKGRYQKDVWVT